MIISSDSDIYISFFKKGDEIKTTSKLVVFSYPRRVAFCWPLLGVLKAYHRITFPAATQSGFLVIFLSRKWIYIFFDTYLIFHIIFFQLVLDIFSYLLLILPTVSTKYPLHQKCLFPYLYFKLACLSKIISVLLLLRVPMNCAALIYGGILTSICMWSRHASASIISTFISLHSFQRITPISFFNLP